MQISTLKPFGGIVIPMEYRTSPKPFSRPLITAILVIVISCLSATSASADSYRWKDKDGNVHYGAAVPPEYANQPYDILNNAGIVIERVEDTTIPLEVIEKNKTQQKRAPLISEEQRQIQSDRLLVFRYASEEDIIKAMELEVAQLGYDMKMVGKSYDDTTAAIRTKVREAADLQRSGQQVSAEQQTQIDELYAARTRDGIRRSTLERREQRVRARYGEELERYRILTSDTGESDQETTDQG